MSNTRQWPEIAAHGMTIGGKHTWMDWYLIPKEIPVFAPPSPKTNYLDVPGANGAIDYTDQLTGSVAYNNRTGSLSFLVLEDADWDWPTAYSTILNFLQGKKMNCILDDDPDFFYSGRFSVNEWQSSRQHSTIAIDYVLDPYKRGVDSTGTHDWLWNELFDLIIYYGTFEVNGTKSRTLINPGTVPVTPTFVCSGPIFVDFNDVTYILVQGETTEPGFKIAPGDNQMVFRGNGTVLVDYSIGAML